MTGVIYKEEVLSSGINNIQNESFKHRRTAVGRAYVGCAYRSQESGVQSQAGRQGSWMGRRWQTRLLENIERLHNLPLRNDSP